MQLVDMTEKYPASEEMRNIQVRVDTALYRRVRAAMAHSDDKFQSLIVRLLEGYVGETSTAGTANQPELERKRSTPKAEPPLPAIPSGINLKSTQVTLYRELAAKVAEVIARGSSTLVAIMAAGIRVAHGELRPNRIKSEDSLAAHVHAHPPASAKKDAAR